MHCEKNTGGILKKGQEVVYVFFLTRIRILMVFQDKLWNMLRE